mmetsp:Transcript_38470/g.114798  ORF Transcript_38470/g.114798 Transcript_38470/m.114798 type:complete len:160 (+) Transcript_38470:1-480(+)
MASVSGVVYAQADVPAVRLFTKEGCTLCDKVRDVLRGVTDRAPHSLEAVDITDEDHAQWLAKYKYDIPVLHLDGPLARRCEGLCPPPPPKPHPSHRPQEPTGRSTASPRRRRSRRWPRRGRALSRRGAASRTRSGWSGGRRRGSASQPATDVLVGRCAA